MESKIYGIEIDLTKSDPFEAVSYTDDAVGKDPVSDEWIKELTNSLGFSYTMRISPSSMVIENLTFSNDVYMYSKKSKKAIVIKLANYKASDEYKILRDEKDENDKITIPSNVIRFRYIEELIKMFISKSLIGLKTL